MPRHTHKYRWLTNKKLVCTEPNCFQTVSPYLVHQKLINCQECGRQFLWQFEPTREYNPGDRLNCPRCKSGLGWLTVEEQIEVIRGQAEALCRESLADYEAKVQRLKEAEQRLKKQRESFALMLGEHRRNWSQERKDLTELRLSSRVKKEKEHKPEPEPEPVVNDEDALKAEIAKLFVQGNLG